MRSEKVLSYIDNLPASLTIDVPEDTLLTLNIAAFEKLQSSKIVVKVHRDADFEAYMADFSVFQGKIEVLVENVGRTLSGLENYFSKQVSPTSNH